jgi:hypothetical protein
MKEYLQMMAMSQSPHIPQSMTSKEQYILDNGRAMSSEPLDEEQRSIVETLTQTFEPQPKECFFNAMFMCMVSVWDKELTSRIKYCEGYVSCKSPFPVHHAWITLDGKVVDLTLTTNKYTLEQLTAFMHEGVELSRNEDLSDRILGEIPEDWQYFGVEFESKKVGQQFVERGSSFSLIDDWERGWPLLQKNDQTQDQILYK